MHGTRIIYVRRQQNELDKGLPEYLPDRFGMDKIGLNIIEVSGSSWAQEVTKLWDASPARNWGRRSTTWKSTAVVPQKLFIIPLKEKTL